MRTVLRDARGFTLVELLVATAVLGVIMSAVLLVQMMGQQSYAMGSNRVETQQNARVALELMTRELRSAQAVTAFNGSTDITFRNQNDVVVQYQLSGTTLNRISGGETRAIIGGVQSLTLSYCRLWNAATASCTTAAATAGDVRTIRVQLTARTEESVATNSLADRNAKVESTIRLRNVP